MTQAIPSRASRTATVNHVPVRFCLISRSLPDKVARPAIVSLGPMAMPIHWTISHSTRLVLAICKDVVNRPDVEAYLDGVVVDGALSYAKIFELKDCTWTLDDQDMMALGARIQAYANVAKEAMDRSPSSRPRPSTRTRRGSSVRWARPSGH